MKGIPMADHDELNEMINDVSELVKLDDDELLAAPMDDSNEGIKAIDGFVNEGVIGEIPEGFRAFKKMENDPFQPTHNNLEFLKSMYNVLKRIYDMRSYDYNAIIDDSIIDGIQDDFRNYLVPKSFFYWAHKLMEYMNTYESIGTLTKPMRTAVAECMRMMIRLVLLILLAYKQGNMAIVQTLMIRYICEHEYSSRMKKIDKRLAYEEKSLYASNSGTVRNEMRRIVGDDM